MQSLVNRVVWGRDFRKGCWRELELKLELLERAGTHDNWVRMLRIVSVSQHVWP